jgi:hypothetical protein
MKMSWLKSPKLFLFANSNRKKMIFTKWQDLVARTARSCTRRTIRKLPCGTRPSWQLPLVFVSRNVRLTIHHELILKFSCENDIGFQMTSPYRNRDFNSTFFYRNALWASVHRMTHTKLKSGWWWRRQKLDDIIWRREWWGRRKEV